MRQAGYAALRAAIDTGPTTKDVAGPDGKTYQVETSAFWDRDANGPIRVIVAIDDGGWRAFVPLTADDIIAAG